MSLARAGECAVVGAGTHAKQAEQQRGRPSRQMKDVFEDVQLQAKRMVKDHAREAKRAVEQAKDQRQPYARTMRISACQEADPC